MTSVRGMRSREFAVELSGDEVARQQEKPRLRRMKQAGRTSKLGVVMRTILGLNVPKIICGKTANEGPFKCSMLSTRIESAYVIYTCHPPHSHFHTNDRFVPFEPLIMLFQPSLPDLHFEPLPSRRNMRSVRIGI